MIDEISLAKVICRAFLEKKRAVFGAGGGITSSMEPGFAALIEREVAKNWQSFLPESRAVLKVMNDA